MFQVLEHEGLGLIEDQELYRREEVEINLVLLLCVLVFFLAGEGTEAKWGGD